MTGVCPGFNNATVSLTLSITCFMVATEWAWSRSRGSNDVILTSNSLLLCSAAWWADHVMLRSSSTSSVTIIFSSHSYSFVRCGLSKPGPGKDKGLEEDWGSYLWSKLVVYWWNIQAALEQSSLWYLLWFWMVHTCHLYCLHLDAGRWKCWCHEMMCSLLSQSGYDLCCLELMMWTTLFSMLAGILLHPAHILWLLHLPAVLKFPKLDHR